MRRARHGIGAIVDIDSGSPSTAETGTLARTAPRLYT